MVALLKRPKDASERQLFDAVGAIRAARFVRKYAKTNKLLNVGVILSIQNEIFKDWWPEIAGKLRGEEVALWHSKHLPPHHSQIGAYMDQLDKKLEKSLSSINTGRLLSKNKKTYFKEFIKIIQIAAEAHHEISWIHPFRDGNGRAARLMANLILQRFGLWGISSQVERENKEEYLKALSQIDNFGDFQPLIDMVTEGLAERYRKSRGLKMFNKS